MKKIFYVSMLVLAGVFVVSCGSDDKPTPTPIEPTNEQKVEGRWYAKDVKAIQDGQEFVGHVYEGECEKKTGFTFNLDHTIVSISAELNEETNECVEKTDYGTYTINDEKVTFIIPNEDPQVFKYTVSGSQLVLTREQSLDTNGETVMIKFTLSREL